MLADRFTLKGLRFHLFSGKYEGEEYSLARTLFPSSAPRQTIATIYKFLDCELQSITLHATCSLAF